MHDIDYLNYPNPLKCYDSTPEIIFNDSFSTYIKYILRLNNALLTSLPTASTTSLNNSPIRYAELVMLW